MGGAARDAGQLWDANPLESLALGLDLKIAHCCHDCATCRTRGDNERSLGRPVPGVRLIRGLNRTKKVTTSRAVPPLFLGSV